MTVRVKTTFWFRFGVVSSTVFVSDRSICVGVADALSVSSSAETPLPGVESGSG